MKGREVVAHREGDQRLPPTSELDLLHRPDVGAADHHVVALDQLAGVLERGRDLVLVAAAEQDVDDRRADDERDHGQGAPPSPLRLLLLGPYVTTARRPCLANHLTVKLPVVREEDAGPSVTLV